MSETADLVTFTEDILNVKLHFLYSILKQGRFIVKYFLNLLDLNLLNLIVTQKVSKKRFSLRILKKDHTRDSKINSHSGFFYLALDF